MNALLFLIPLSLGLAILALTLFRWTLRHAQYDDMLGDSLRVLAEDDKPLSPQERKTHG